MESTGIEPANLPFLLKGLKQFAAKAPRKHFVFRSLEGNPWLYERCSRDATHTVFHNADAPEVAAHVVLPVERKPREGCDQAPLRKPWSW